MTKFGSLFAVRKLGDSDGILLENCAEKEQRLASLGIYFEESATNELVKYIYDTVPEPDHCIKLLNSNKQNVLILLLAQSQYSSFTEAVIDFAGSVDNILKKFHDDSVVFSLDTPEYDVDDAIVDDTIKEEKTGAIENNKEDYKEIEQTTQEVSTEPSDRISEIYQIVMAISRYLGVDTTAAIGREEIEANAVKEAVSCIFNSSSASLKGALLAVFVDAVDTGKDVSLCANFFAKLIQHMNLDELK